MEVGYHQFTLNQDDNQNSSENSDDSLPSPQFYDTKATSTSKKSRRGTHKRVVHVPMKEVEGSRLKGETNAPPADSWAWRKYGQKPIKGSPYPRSYYRCSSSKGCPARKQVERSRTDPTMVMVTYSCEHNHSWPASRNNNHHHHHNTASSPPTSPTTTEAPTNSNNDDQLEEEEEEEAPTIITRRIEPEQPEQPEPEQRFTSLDQMGPFSTTTDQYGWFSDLDSTSSTMLESPLIARDLVEDSDMTMIFSIREDEESFFADLGELPECTTVFRRREIEPHHNLAPWCGTT